MFAYRRTPYLGLIFGAAIGFAVTSLVEAPERPLTLAQAAIFYLLSYLPGLGLAMLSDPRPRTVKAEYLKINFYAPKEPPAASRGPERAVDPPSAASTQEGDAL